MIHLDELLSESIGKRQMFRLIDIIFLQTSSCFFSYGNKEKAVQATFCNCVLPYPELAQKSSVFWDTTENRKMVLTREKSRECIWKNAAASAGFML